jgi:GNAT superfamily N-acetyltransferase
MDTLAVEIHAATAADHQVLAHQRVAMFRDMGEVHASTEPDLLDAATLYFASAIRTGEYSAWLARTPEGVIVGGAGVQRRSLLPRPSPRGAGLLLGLEGVVLNVYVEPSWRRRGIARALMQAILDWAPTVGIVRLVLHPSAEGRPLYESMGFVPTDELRFDGRLAARNSVPGLRAER